MEFQVGDRVRRVRGGMHEGMLEGAEGIVTRVRRSPRGNDIIELDAYGNTGFDPNNYFIVPYPVPPFQGNIDPCHVFKKGDKVVIVTMTSGLSQSLIGRSGIINSTTVISRTYASLQLEDGHFYDIWVDDLRLAKPPVETNFKAYLKAKMGANVASV